MEEWKDVVGYEGLYQVSNLGRVKGLEKIVANNWGFKKWEERILKPGIVQGYSYVVLRKDKTSRNFRVHRLVALAFIPNPENKPCIDHINGCRTDNWVENLKWVTYSENINNHITKQRQRKKRLGYKHDKNTIDKISNKAIKRPVLCVETGLIYESMSKAAKENNTYKDGIYRVCRGINKTAGGYHWQYVEN